jgi:hypothetical protein
MGRVAASSLVTFLGSAGIFFLVSPYICILDYYFLGYHHRKSRCSEDEALAEVALTSCITALLWLLDRGYHDNCRVVNVVTTTPTSPRGSSMRRGITSSRPPLVVASASQPQHF